jgi:hypothetical protein
VSLVSPAPISVPLPARVSVREALPWTVFAGVLILVLLYFLGAEQGATSIISGHYLHEFLHDGRHLLGFPCH